MSDEKNEAEPSGASGGSVACPYVTGTITRYCTLTPFTLTDAEREALGYEVELAEYQQRHDLVATLRGLLSRTGDCPTADNVAGRDNGTTGSEDGHLDASRQTRTN